MSKFMPVKGNSAADLLMNRRKQKKKFNIVCSICVGFFNTYVNFHQPLSCKRKGKYFFLNNYRTTRENVRIFL